MQQTLKELAELTDSQLHGDPHVVISGVGTLEQAEPAQVTFLDNAKYRVKLDNTRASAVILKSNFVASCPTNALINENPYLAYAKVAGLFSTRQSPNAGCHPTVVMGANCQVAASAAIGPNVVLGDHVCVGENVSIGAGTVIGDACKIGADTRLFANVTLYEQVIIGQRCVIHSGAILGADGFGLANDRGAWERVPQLGRVILGNDVDVGANSAIDRGAIEDTRLDDGVKIDNLVQIGHNVQIGAHTAIAGCAGIAGSTTIGKHCLIGGGACIAGHIQLADRVCISGMSGVRNSIQEPGLYASSLSVMPDKKWRRNHARLKHLDEWTRRVQNLEKSRVEDDEREL